MASEVDARDTAVLRRAAVRATYAPSVHNTQPWQFVLRAGELRIYANRSRQLTTADPSARQLVISCGSALMNARVSIAASGLGASVERLPHGAGSDLLAKVRTTDDQNMPPGFSALDGMVELRETNRRRFADNPVPAEVVLDLGDAAAAEGCTLFVVEREVDRLAVATSVRKADALRNVDPAYRAEIKAWTSDDPGPDDTRPAPTQCLVLLCTADDRPLDWLRAGEALERILLEVTKRGFVAGPPTQALELLSVRAELRAQLRLSMCPQMLLRIGRAPPTPAARRRRLVDVLVEEA
jgi:hypothetical protein